MTQEEVVPNAFSSRPNLVTNAGLVDQAFSLAQYDIDSCFKYDAAFGGAPTERKPPNAMVDTLTRERILNHHRKLVELQFGEAEEGETSSPVSSTPKNLEDETAVSPTTAALVATLRQIFGDSMKKGAEDDGSFELRQLLEDVTSHSILETTSIDRKQHLESILGTLCRTFASDDHAHYVQGVLLAVLSLLAPEDDNTKPTQPPNPKVPPEDAPKDDDGPRPPRLLQVGSLMHLFPLVPLEEESIVQELMLKPELNAPFKVVTEQPISLSSALWGRSNTPTISSL